MAEKVGLLQPWHRLIVGGQSVERRQVEIGCRLADQRRRNEVRVKVRLEDAVKKRRNRNESDQRQQDEERSPPSGRGGLVLGNAHARPPWERRRTPRDSSSANRRRWVRPSSAIQRTRPRSTAAAIRYEARMKPKWAGFSGMARGGKLERAHTAPEDLVAHRHEQDGDEEKRHR